YLGREDREQARLSGNQLLFSTTLISLVIMTFCLFGQSWLLETLYGNVESAVMENARIYFFWSALSYPFLALYNGGAALFRVMGNTKIALFCSLLMNIVNIGGNAVLIYGFGMGVRGAALASLASRGLAAVVVIYLLRNPACPLALDKTMFRPDRRMIARIMKLGVPNGVENSMFQIGKILVQGVVASMGTVAMAANAVANNIGCIPNIAGGAIGMALVTVVGQSIGAGRKEEAKQYILKLTGVTVVVMTAINLLMLVVVRPVVGVFGLSPETTATTVEIIFWYSIANILFWPLSFTLPNGLRAAGDARFTMLVSTISMWVFRVGSCYLFCFVLGMGVNGTWFAMY
ncbi:MAG: MATE family efflux transporter, partial [Angelakisella sp.]